jgi:hypothetical protein
MKHNKLVLSACILLLSTSLAGCNNEQPVTLDDANNKVGEAYSKLNEQAKTYYDNGFLAESSTLRYCDVFKADSSSDSNEEIVVKQIININSNKIKNNNSNDAVEAYVSVEKVDAKVFEFFYEDSYGYLIDNKASKGYRFNIENDEVVKQIDSSKGIDYKAINLLLDEIQTYLDSLQYDDDSINYPLLYKTIRKALSEHGNEISSYTSSWISGKKTSKEYVDSLISIIDQYLPDIFKAMGYDFINHFSPATVKNNLMTDADIDFVISLLEEIQVVLKDNISFNINDNDVLYSLDENKITNINNSIANTIEKGNEKLINDDKTVKHNNVFKTLYGSFSNAVSNYKNQNEKSLYSTSLNYIFKDGVLSSTKGDISYCDKDGKEKELTVSSSILVQGSSLDIPSIPDLDYQEMTKEEALKIIEEYEEFLDTSFFSNF